MKKLLRIKGRFVNKRMSEFLYDLAKDAKREDAQNFVNENKETLFEFYEKGTFARHYNENTLVDTIANFSGSITINGEKTSKGLSIKKIVEFSSNLKNTTGAVGMSHHVSFGKYGKEMTIEIPEIDEDDEVDEILSDLEEKGIFVYMSEMKAKAKKTTPKKNEPKVSVKHGKQTSNRPRKSPKNKMHNNPNKLHGRGKNRK